MPWVTSAVGSRRLALLRLAVAPLHPIASLTSCDMDHDDAPTGAEPSGSVADSGSRVPVALDLTDVEIRALGCLIEKESTTPDQYPLTTKGLVTACNQKSNRDPVLSLTETEIDQAMLSLRTKELVRAVSQAGARSTKHRHVVGETWELSKAQLAVLAVLFLRGAQTPGELRQRTDRINHFETIGDLNAVLLQLVERRPPLVRELPREPGRRENRWSHLVGEAQDVSVHHAPHPEPGVAAPATAVAAEPTVTSDAPAPSAPAAPATAPVAAAPAALDPAPAVVEEDATTEDAGPPRAVITSAGAKPPKPKSATATEVEELRDRVSSLEASIATLQEKIQSLTGL